MKGEIDWEAAYHELKRHQDTVLLPLLTRALTFVPEEEEDESGEVDEKSKEELRFRGDIAPWDSGYPLIMRAADANERQKLFESAQKKIKNGVWVGAESGSSGHKRPMVGLATKRAREQQKQGLRPSHIRKTRKTSVYQPTVPFPATHIMLVGHGFYPKEGEVGSHLCHNSGCVNVEHLVWESSDQNNRRESLCNKKKICKCGLQPPCDFTLHK